MTFTHELDLH